MNADLERRIAELSLEIRHYPTPIARCDEQLTGLIEERARLSMRLRRLQDEGPCPAAAVWANDGGAAA